jgi:ADP-heptose:LPS heptosyltransferase
MQRIILTNYQSPGDIVILTAAVRDLHRCYPGRYITDVRTSCPQLWENNVFIAPLDESDPDVVTIHCEYPLIHQSNSLPYHFLFGFIEHLNERLSLHIKPTAFHGDIHVSDLEKSWMSQVHEITGDDIPFWIVVSGGKYDFTTKWWDPQRYQDVVDHFRGRIQFVQVGERRHHHPALSGVIDLRDRTDLRELVRLVYHSVGVLAPVSLLMHLAAAVETKPGRPLNRACVVVAGGREPPQWEAYPHHQFIHTNGALPCCDNGGCWKSRVKPLGDGDEKDGPEQLCVDVAGDLPRCLDMITAADVIRRIEVYYQSGYLAEVDSAAEALVG